MEKNSNAASSLSPPLDTNLGCVPRIRIAESIDMLRLIENGYKIRMVKVEGFFQPIDVLDDVKIVEHYLLSNKSIY